MLKVKEHSEQLYALYLVRCLEPANGSNSISTRDPQERRMKEISQHCRTNDNSVRQEGNIPSNSTHAVLLLSTHSLDRCLWGGPIIPLLVIQPAYPTIWPAAPPSHRGLSTNPGVTMWCVCGCSWRDDVCRVCGCYRGGIVVMDVFWRRICVSMIWGREIYLFWVGQGCDEWFGEVSLQNC